MRIDINELKNRMKNIPIYWLFPIFVVALELLFHFEIYKSVDFYMLYAVLFSLPFSLLVLLISSTKHEKWNRISRCIMLLTIATYSIVQIIYHQVFGNFLSLKSIFRGAEQAMDFGSTIWEALFEHVVAIGFVVLLWIAYVVLEILQSKQREMTDGIEKDETQACKKDEACEEEEREDKGISWFAKKQMLLLLSVLVLPIFGTLLLMCQGTGIGTTYDVKLHFHRTEQSMYRLGLTETLKKDLVENICDAIGLSEKQVNAGYTWISQVFFVENVDKSAQKKELVGGNTDSGNGKGQQKKDMEEFKYHTWDIDFDTLIATAANEDIKDVHEYFASQEPTAENVYTGLFEGYNLIYITAESFSDVVIDKERTPTLYQMQQEGFQFENFYTPSWYLSTIDGEYVNCLGQIPVEGDWSLQHSASNELPIALGNQLAEKGYTCNAYHNHDSYYYDRTITHPKLGYEFKAVGAGLTFESMYPESDLELMEITVDEYVGKAPFHTYYMTMSGHLPYTYDYNSIAVKNQDMVEGEWSENAACYLAANVELEYAVAYLVEELEKAGRLEKTLFLIASDHYPYGLKKGAYDELRGKEVEQDNFEIYRNGCLIWSASMKDMKEMEFPVKVEKYVSNLDLLPTVSNLMGLSYDSRLMAGRDMLSEEEGIVLFKDHSFLTEKVRYNATTGEVLWAEGVTEDSIYLETCMELVQKRFYYSAKVLELDYYNQIGMNSTEDN